MTLLEFIDRHIWFTALVAAPITVLTVYLLMVLTEMALKTVWIRGMRALSIWWQGWPPAHCDADGDPVTSPCGQDADKIKELLACLTMGAQVNTPDFLDWIAARLVEVYGESPNVDYVLSLKTRAAAMRKAILNCKTP